MKSIYQFILSSPLILMLISVLCYSLYPLSGVYAENLIDPILFVAIAHFSTFLLMIVHLKLFASKNIMATLRAVPAKEMRQIIVGGSLNGISHGALIAAVTITHPDQVAIIYETWPIIITFLLVAMMPKQFRSLTFDDLLYSVIGLCGVVLVGLSNASSGEFSIDHLTSRDVFGLALAALSSLTMAMSSANGIAVTKYFNHHHNDLEASSLAQLFTKIPSTLSPLLLWPFIDTPHTLSAEGVGLAVLTGLVIITIGAATYLIAHQKTQNAAVNIIFYLNPLLAIAWLILSGHADFNIKVAIGAILIICANLMMAIRTETNMHFSFSLAGLTISAVYVYFVPGLGSDQFYSMLAVPVAIFAIMSAFLIDRTYRKSEASALAAIRLLETYVTDRTLDEDSKARFSGVLSKVLAADNYVAAEAVIAKEKQDRTNCLNPDQLNELRILALRDGDNISFGEIFIVLLIGLCVGLFGNIFRPNALEADILAIILTAVVTYLVMLIVTKTPSQIMRNAQIFLGLNKEEATNKRTLNRVWGYMMICLLLLAVNGLAVSKYLG